MVRGKSHHRAFHRAKKEVTGVDFLRRGRGCATTLPCCLSCMIVYIFFHTDVEVNGVP